MAQTAAMGPPLSPRETRRSGRRSAPSTSTSASKSPDSPTEEPRTSARPSLSTSNSSGRSKRFKQEDLEQTVEEHEKSGATVTAPNGTTPHGNGNGRTKRKGKEKTATTEASSVDPAALKSSGGPSRELSVGDTAEEEEQGFTRCVCGSTEDDPDAGEFMVQCETCGAWQHGLCMGYESEDQLPNDDYHCELCRPDLHHDLLKKLSRRARQSSTTSAPAASRLSRSHSPSHLLKQPAKRRNTMNSRDAAFDQLLQETLKATAAEDAGAHDDHGTVNGDGSVKGQEDGEEEVDVGRKKRKRTEDDAIPAKKRTRSASSASDRPEGSVVPKDETPTVNGSSSKTSSATTRVGPGRGKRGGRRPAVAHELAASVDGEEGALQPPSSKRQSAAGRAKGGPAPKRPPISQSAGGSASTHEHGTRRNNGSGGGVNGTISSTTTAIAYRNSHAYAVSQQTLFTSWNLPDYLAHLELMLPTDTPRPLEVRGSGVGDDGERGVERGVKVKWPSKRMSVGDMNKRVRSLVEWVVREQAGATERGKRREALERVLRTFADDEHRMVLDVQMEVVSPKMEKGAAEGEVREEPMMKMMEELMEELLSFQERFGPGAKNRERERRLAPSSVNS